MNRTPAAVRYVHSRQSLPFAPVPIRFIDSRPRTLQRRPAQAPLAAWRPRHRWHHRAFLSTGKASWPSRRRRHRACASSRAVRCGRRRVGVREAAARTAAGGRKKKERKKEEEENENTPPCTSCSTASSADATSTPSAWRRPRGWPLRPCAARAAAAWRAHWLPVQRRVGGSEKRVRPGCAPKGGCRRALTFRRSFSSLASRARWLRGREHGGKAGEWRDEEEGMSHARPRPPRAYVISFTSFLRRSSFSALYGTSSASSTHSFWLWMQRREMVGDVSGRSGRLVG